MVYVTDDGVVQLSFLHGKKILDYYKKLCSGKKAVLAELVAEFNQETDDGHDMKHYSNLLEAAILKLVGRKQEIGVASLFKKGGTALQNVLFDGMDDFELITFLVLK
jgi:hypothetical protein